MKINGANLEDIDLFILDMDGTFYLGNDLFDGSLEFLKTVKEKNKKFMFLTNNSSKSARDYIIKLSKIGIDITGEQIFTSGEATCIYLKDRYPKNTKYFVLGTESLVEEFESYDLKVDFEDPDVLVLGYDTSLTYDKLSKACLFIRRGIDYIATHPDINCPSPEGLIPDAGAFIELIKASTSRSPSIIIGKPSKDIILGAMKKAKCTGKAAMIGDRLYTDIAAANNAGITSILVLSGETQLKDLEGSDIRPTYIFDSIKEITNKI